jgi:hypothetical protein
MSFDYNEEEQIYYRKSVLSCLTQLYNHTNDVYKENIRLLLNDLLNEIKKKRINKENVNIHLKIISDFIHTHITNYSELNVLLKNLKTTCIYINIVLYL